ncbi:MAG: cyanophycin synthetase [Bacteroidales bacterium]|nr:cyanophycin synthetase [Bacteroidales bacterium]
MQLSLEDYQNYKIIDGPLKIENIQVYHGANYFSGGPIVLLRINLGEYDEVFTNDINGFYEKLTNILPSLFEHHCSVGKPGGFFIRVKEGTLLGHVTEHTSIELQTLAGMDVGYGKTRSTLQQGVYNVIFRYLDEIAGVYAGKAALNLVNSLLLNKEFDVFEVIEALVHIRELRMFGPSTQAIVDEAANRNIPFIRLDSYNLVQLGTGKFRKYIRATITSDTDLIAVETADDKYLTSLMLKDAGIPVLETIKTDNVNKIIDFQKTLNTPIVVKPTQGYLGKNSMVNISSQKEINEAFDLACEFDDTVIAQPYLKGKSFRLLVIDYKFIAATELAPPFITGNGKNTISQLIENLNANSERQIGDKAKLSKVQIDITTERILKAKEYTLETVLPENEILVLKKSGNPKLGGSSIDVTDKVHPFNRFLAERAARVIGLNIAGVDIIAPNINESIIENNGAVIEVNAAPDFRMHINPSLGKSRNVAANLVDMLFPVNTQTRVPVYSVTGTAGKTITVTLLNYCLEQEGFNTGLTTSDGLYITGKCLMKGDMTYPEHVALVLKDPTIDCAILETPREGILRRGLGYEYADFGIFLNMYNEHLGNDDIKYIEDLAYAKSVVAEQVYENGYAILNADNELVMESKERVYCNLVLFSKNYNNKEIKDHIAKGGLAVFINDNKIFISIKDKIEELMPLYEIPLTFENKAKFMYDSVLAVVSTLITNGIDLNKIRKYLSDFKPDINTLPGRLNFIKIKDFTVLIDNAHNLVSFKGLKDFLDNFKEYKIGVIDAAGDRSDEEIINLGVIASETYDEIFFYEGIDNRGRNNGEIITLLKKGAIQKEFPEDKIKVFINYKEAWETAIREGKKDYLITILTVKAQETYNLIEKIS